MSETMTDEARPVATAPTISADPAGATPPDAVDPARSAAPPGPEDPSGASAPAGPEAPGRSRHHWLVRLTHWVNVVALTAMVASGLRIFNAYPAFAPRGRDLLLLPVRRPAHPGVADAGRLAGRRPPLALRHHVAAGGQRTALRGFIYLHGEWRDLAPRRGDPRDAWEMVKFYLFARREHPRQGKHNALQKLAYLSLLVLAVIAVASGLAIWKPVQLGWLTRLMGGYVWARYWHFLAMLGLVALGLIHVFMVVSVDPYSIPAMITGRYRADRSPERRNARPFQHLFGPVRPSGATAEATGADAARERRAAIDPEASRDDDTAERS